MKFDFNMYLLNVKREAMAQTTEKAEQENKNLTTWREA